MSLFYVSDNNSIIELEISDESFTPATQVLILDSEPAIQREGSRSLSATSYTINMTNGSFEDYLIFQNIYGTATFLQRKPNNYSVPWKDITESLNASLPTSTFGTPFASCFFDENVFMATFFDPHATREQTLIEFTHTAGSTDFSSGIIILSCPESNTD